MGIILNKCAKFLLRNCTKIGWLKYESCNAVGKEFKEYHIKRKIQLPIIILIPLILTFLAFLVVFKPIQFYNYTNIFFRKMNYFPIISDLFKGILTLLALLCTIVGIALSNIAKNNRYSYKVLMNRAHIYPIVWFFICSSFTFLLILLFSDSFNEWWLRAAILFEMLLFSILLGSILFSMRRILQYASEDRILEILVDEASYEYIENEFENEISKQSINIFYKMIEEFKSPQLRVNFNFVGNPLSISDVLGLSKTREIGYIKITNINFRDLIDSLEKYSKKYLKQFQVIYLNPLGLMKVHPDVTIIAFTGSIESNMLKSIYKKNIKYEIHKETIITASQFFEERLESSIINNDYHEADRYISVAEIIKANYCDYTKNIEISNHQGIEHFFLTSYTKIDDLDRLMSKLTDISIKRDYDRILARILSYYYHVLRVSILNQNIIITKDILDYFGKLYKKLLSLYSKPNLDANNLVIDNLPLMIRDLTYLCLDKYDSFNDIQLNKASMQFGEICNLFFIMGLRCAELKKYNQLKNIVNSFNDSCQSDRERLSNLENSNMSNEDLQIETSKSNQYYLFRKILAQWLYLRYILIFKCYQLFIEKKMASNICNDLYMEIIDSYLDIELEVSDLYNIVHDNNLQHLYYIANLSIDFIYKGYIIFLVMDRIAKKMFNFGANMKPINFKITGEINTESLAKFYTNLLSQVSMVDAESIQLLDLMRESNSAELKSTIDFIKMQITSLSNNSITS